MEHKWKIEKPPTETDCDHARPRSVFQQRDVAVNPSPVPVLCTCFMQSG